MIARRSLMSTGMLGGLFALGSTAPAGAGPNAATGGEPQRSDEAGLRRIAEEVKDLKDLIISQRQFTGKKSGADEIAPVLDCETVCVLDSFPPVHRCLPLVGAGCQSGDCAPRLGFGRTQQERVARFSIGLAPLSLLDESECLTGKAT